MRGRFDRRNVVRTINPALYYRVDSTATGYYESAVVRDADHPRDSIVLTHRMDIVTGSGRRGQSFLSWREGNRLYQLPISYWASVGWANSPNYRDGVVNFDRPIAPRCLECHVGGLRPLDANNREDNRYDPHTLMLGLTCETCHAAGQEHVARERMPLHAYLPKAIMNPARLTRRQQMDGCALCHGGAVDLQNAPYSYVAGQVVRKVPDLRSAPDTNVDVHGNQVALLERSRCYRASQMTCLTCHDVHRTQRNTVELSGVCLKCHALPRLSPTHSPASVGRCVDCHMPVLPSRTVVASSDGKRVVQTVRSHWIKVYR